MSGTTERITGSVERITYYNPENGYSVLRLRPDRGRIQGVNRDGLVTIIGNLPELSPGEHLRLTGQWVNHPKHGLQFQSEVCEQILPATLAGIRRYLGSGLVKGIGPRLADRIVAQFGLQTLDVIEKQPERLREVADIGPKRSRLIAAAWQEQKQVKEIMLFLHSHAVSTNLAIKIYKQYGDQALEVVRNDPYRLARDIFGVGFKTADRIAQSLGLPADHPRRIEAGLLYALNENSNEGNVYAPQPVLTQQAAELLQVAPELIPPALERLGHDQLIHEELLPYQAEEAPIPGSASIGEGPAAYGQAAVYLTPLYYSETGVAERLAALASAWPSRLSDLPPAFVMLDPMLSAEQQEAIRNALSHPLSVLTGGPGTGKTTCLKALIAALEAAHKTYALASPTGRAAKRLSQATGRPASTIHRLLGFSPGEGFKHNAENPLQIDLLVIDEAYVDFAPASALGLLRRFPNVAILRTLSKSFSLAGMRLGLCFAHPGVIEELLKVKDSYNLSRIALAAGAAALDDAVWMRRNVERVRKTRAETERKLRALGFEVPPSEANFVLARMPGRDMGPVTRALRRAGFRTVRRECRATWSTLTLARRATRAVPRRTASAR